MNCTNRSSYVHTSYISSFASTVFIDEEGWNYFYIIVFEGEKKVVNIYDYLRKQIVAEITYQGTYDAEITSISASN